MTQSSSVLYKQSTAPGSSVSKHDRERWEVGENTDTFFNKCKFLTFYCCSNKARLWYYKKLLRFGFRYWNKRHPRGISRSGANGTTYECLTHVSAVKSQFKNNNNKKDSLDWYADILFAIVCIRSSLSDQIQNLTREDEVTPSWSTPPISPCSSSSCTKYLECTCGDH